MTIRLAINIPSCSPMLASSLNAAFKLSKVSANATFTPTKKSCVHTEHLCCPVEPADAINCLFIELPDDQAALQQTLVDVDFFMHAVAQYPQQEVPAEDIFAFECIITSILARDITYAFLKNQKPRQLMTQAKKTAKRSLWIEDKLGTPNLSELLTSFADTLLARGFR